MIKAIQFSGFEKEYNTDYYIGDNLTFNTSYIYNGADELLGIKDTYGNYFNFSYDSLGRKIKLKDPDLGTWSYQYDLAGNLISQVGGGGNLQTGDSYYREYNGLGQLKSVKEGNNSNSRILEEYFYDSNGDRIKINRYSYSGGTNETIYTPYKDWMQIRNSSGIFNFYYIYQDNVLVSRLNPDGTKWFYHADHLGSTSLITDEQGSIVEQEFFSPFGESLSENKEEEFKLYTGQFKDTVGQYYYKSRYYKPDWTRFNECDKVKFNVYDPQALNCYSYGLNNPYKYIDPSGKVAKLRIDDKNKIANVETTIYIYGKGASEKKAQKIQDKIMKSWNDKTYQSVSGLYKVKLDVKVINVGKMPEKLGKYENAVEIKGFWQGLFHRSYVTANRKGGVWTDKSLIQLGLNNRVFAHEAGHLFGIKDRYTDASGTQKGYENTLMSGESKIATEKDVSNVLHESFIEHESSKTIETIEIDKTSVDIVVIPNTEHLLDYED